MQDDIGVGCGRRRGAEILASRGGPGSVGHAGDATSRDPTFAALTAAPVDASNGPAGGRLAFEPATP